jgi:uncharacterized membrane protein
VKISGKIERKIFIFVVKPKKPETMKKIYKPLVCILSIIAIVLMLIGIILAFAHTTMIGKAPHMYYLSDINFILFAILFHIAGRDSEAGK